MAHVETFRAAASKGGSLALDDFLGKVPVVLAFLGPLDNAHEEIRLYDRHLADFGRHRIQLLCVVTGDGIDVRAVPFDGVNVPVLADPHEELAARFADPASDRRAGFAVIVDLEGQIADRILLNGDPSHILERAAALGLGAA
jgi:hypothetical protein